MQNQKQLYIELCEKVNEAIPEFRWIDLWNSQVFNLVDEHPFPTPALFIAFRSSDMQDLGLKTQKVRMQVDFFVFYETFAESYKGSFNQTDAFAILDLIDQLNAVMHASSGQNYSSMSRRSMSPVDSGGSGNLFNITYECEMIDYSASNPFDEGSFQEVEIEKYDL
jgi:hypothetical protein